MKLDGEEIDYTVKLGVSGGFYFLNLELFLHIATSIKNSKMENLQRKYNELLKAYKTWSLLSERWLFLLKRKDYIAANIAKSEAENADLEFKEILEQLEKQIVKLKDPSQISKITDELKNNEVMIQQLEKNLAKLTF